MPTIPETTSRKSVTLPDSLWEKIGQYRFYRGIPTEAEAIRQILQSGLDFGQAIKTVIDIATRKTKFVPGPFEQGRRNYNVLLDLLSADIRRHNPALSLEQAEGIAKSAYTNATRMVGDEDAAISLLNMDWRWFVG